MADLKDGQTERTQRAQRGRHANVSASGSQPRRESASQHVAEQAAEEGSGRKKAARRASRSQSRQQRKDAKRAAKQQKHEEKKAAKRQKGPGIVRRTINHYTDRLLGAAKEGNLSGQEEEYAAGRTTADYIGNTAGLAAFGMVFPLLTIVVTQLCGAEQAGRFSLAFVTAQLLLIIANYGIRTYQVSDVKEVRSFAEYQVNRWITCIGMLLIGYLYCCIRGYTGEMMTMFIWVFVYRMVDGLADVYEGRLQQMDKLYLAGASQAIRSVLAFAVCTIVLFLTRDLGLASICMGVAAIASFVVITFPLTMFETPKSRRLSIGGVAQLFKDGFPVFLALFLYQFIDNMPKFVMEGVLTYDNQLYFNALYFPAQAILMTVGFIYKPMLVRIANAWADPSRRKRFDLFVIAMVALIAVITAIGIVFMGWIGIPIMSFLYGLDFEQFRTMSYVMLVAGGVTGIIDFLYQVVTVMRHQRDVMKLYIVTFGFSLFVPYLMVHTTGLNGAIDGYLIVMSFLAALLAMEYITVRLNYAKHPERDPNYLQGSPLEAKNTHTPRRGTQARTVVHRRSDFSQPPAQGIAVVKAAQVSAETARPSAAAGATTGAAASDDRSVQAFPSGVPASAESQSAGQPADRVVYFVDDAPQAGQSGQGAVPPGRSDGGASDAASSDFTTLPANHVRRDIHVPSVDASGAGGEVPGAMDADDPWDSEAYDMDSDDSSQKGGAHPGSARR